MKSTYDIQSAKTSQSVAAKLAGLVRLLHELGVNEACAVKHLNCILRRLQVSNQHAADRTGRPQRLKER
jgi:hypothetical protein